MATLPTPRVATTLLSALATGYNLLLIPDQLLDQTAPVLCGDPLASGTHYYEFTATARPHEKGYICSQCLQGFLTALANGLSAAEMREIPDDTPDAALLRDLYHALRDPTDLYTLGDLMERAQQRLGE